jgi:hypothetical protein
VASFRSPVCFMNFGLILYRHRYCTYYYYWDPLQWQKRPTTWWLDEALSGALTKETHYSDKRDPLHNDWTKHLVVPWIHWRNTWWCFDCIQEQRVGAGHVGLGLFWHDIRSPLTPICFRLDSSPTIAVCIWFNVERINQSECAMTWKNLKNIIN